MEVFHPVDGDGTQQQGEMGTTMDQDAMLLASVAEQQQQQEGEHDGFVSKEKEMNVVLQSENGDGVVDGGQQGGNRQQQVDDLNNNGVVGVEWLGQGILKEEEFGNARLCYKGFERKDIGQVRVGDCVYVTPAEQSMKPFIAVVKELYSMGENSMGVFGWYSRPEELEVDAPLPIFRNEVFAVDDEATLPLLVVCGRCCVLDPRAYLKGKGHSMNITDDDVYVCSRKYVAEEGRVVPLGEKEDVVSEHDREYVLVEKRIEPGVRKKVSEDKPSKRRKRRASVVHQGEEEEDAPVPVVKTKGGRLVVPPKTSYAYTMTDDGQLANYVEAKPVPKSKYGRWTAERYKAAQASLVVIMKQLGAVHPHKAILRPRLREEARRGIGDTGLLDHLLKHLSDEVVSETGERLRRRHNRNGHMEYWLQDASAAVEEEQMLQDEMTALTAELREIREARNLIQTVRNEAADAVKTIQVIGNVASPHQESYDLPQPLVDAITSMKSALDGMTRDSEALTKQLERLERAHEEEKERTRRMEQELLAKIDAIASSSIQSEKHTS
jgi:hypothetical protein